MSGELAQGIGAFATATAAGVAWWQIGALKRQQRGWSTLEICQKYNTDPVLDKALDALRVARNSGDLAADPKKYRFEAIAVLTYLEGIATGQEQLFYDTVVVKEHMEPIVRETVREFFDPALAGPMGLDRETYKNLLRLIDRWDRQSFMFSR